MDQPFSLRNVMIFFGVGATVAVMLEVVAAAAGTITAAA